MYSTYHFESASEVNEDVPEWQKQLVFERQKYYEANPHELIEWEEAKKLIRLD